MFNMCSQCFIKVTWQKLVNGSKQNVAIANPSLGVSVAPPYRDRVTFKNGAVRRRTPNLEDTTISFSSLRLSDEATYICEYTTFPAGNRENTVNLTVYGGWGRGTVVLMTPDCESGEHFLFFTISSSNNSDEPVHANVSGSFIQCENASGHVRVFQWEASCSHQVCVALSPPCRTSTLANSCLLPANRWETSVPGEVTTREYRNSDGTFTVQSDYILVPSRETHKETLTCVTTYNEEVFTDSVTLDIQCKQGNTCIICLPKAAEFRYFCASTR